MASTFIPNKRIPSVVKQLPTTIDPGKPVPHLVTPQTAVHLFKAEGEFGDKVAGAGFSVSNYGLYASSAQGVGFYAVGAELAAEFEGNVKMRGGCDVIGDLRTRGNLVCDGHLHTLGNHTVDGDIQLTGADYAEDFDIADVIGADPGTVMVLDDTGGVRMSNTAYDRRVAGVVSGAGGYKPAVILDRQRPENCQGMERRPLALMGKVYCKVDASNAPIAVGDLLTTSSTPGHAMKAVNPQAAFGAVIGKALRPLAGGLGLVPILVALQ